ncbi:monocarboxylate transporter 13-like [Patiria miniata]|uniref:Major facilitator superfamily (MFS) profile domain-containing protein n=1 Tax=Patiria miniata TaxID=46514 RepID=A0A914A849_PATMI|nr:monocarboxylate transporter 13-like [Patiria miniata]
MASLKSIDLRSFFQRHQGCCMVLIAFVELFIVLGSILSYNILFARFQEEFGSGAAITGWVGSLASTLLFCNPISPLLIQRYGPRAVTLLGAVVFTGGLVATSFVPGLPYAIVTYGVLVGVGGNFIVQSVVLVVFNWFPGKNCSRAMSVALLGPPFASLTFAPLFIWLIEDYGWRICLRTVGGGSFVLSVFHAAFIVTPIKVKVQALAATRVKCKHRHDGALTSQDGASNIDLGNGESDELACKNLPRKKGKVLLQADTWMWLFGFLLGNIGWTFIAMNYASFMEHDLHFTTNQITVALVLASTGEIEGKVLFSIFGGRLPCLKLYVVVGTLLLGGLVSGLMVVLRTVPLVYVISFIVGPIRGVSYVSPCPATMELFGDHGSDVVTLLFMIPNGFGFFFGSLLTGGLYDLTGDYTMSLIVTSAMFVCAALGILAIPIWRRWQSGTGTELLCRSSTAGEKIPQENTVFEVSTQTTM